MALDLSSLYAEKLDQVERKFKLGNRNLSLTSRRDTQLSTRLLQLDLLMGGGILPGRWLTVFGGEGSAKSTTVSHILISAAEQGIPAVHFDYEGSTDPNYLSGIIDTHSKLNGVEDLYGLQDAKGKWVIPRKVRLASTNTAEQFFDSCASYMRNLPEKIQIGEQWWYAWDNEKLGRELLGANYSKSMYTKYKRIMTEAPDGKAQGLFVTDSYPAMYPEALDTDDPSKGLAVIARAMSLNIPKIQNKLAQKGMVIVGVNQLRLRPGVSYGSPEYEPGGEALKFASTIRIRNSAIAIPHGKGAVEEEPSILGEGVVDTYRYIKSKAIKNKSSTPWLECIQRLWVNDGNGQARGFDPVWDTFQYLVKTGQCEGTMKKMVIPTLTSQPLTWMAFKKAILLKGEPLKEHLVKIGAPPTARIRARCMKQLPVEGIQKYFETVKATK